MRISVIVGTYESPSSLARVLEGYATQTHLPVEIGIAGDGSEKSRAQVAQSLRQSTNMNRVHVWLGHRSFRKCAIANNAIRVARADDLAFTDGDCIPRKDFFEFRRSLARPGRSLSGGLFRLPQNVCHRMDRHGLTLSRQSHRLTLRRRCGEWTDLCTATHPNIQRQQRIRLEA